MYKRTFDSKVEKKLTFNAKQGVLFIYLFLLLIIILCQCVMINTHVLIHDTGFQCHHHIYTHRENCIQTKSKSKSSTRFRGPTCYILSMFALQQYEKY